MLFNKFFIFALGQQGILINIFNEIEKESFLYSKHCIFMFGSDILVILLGTLCYGLLSWYRKIDVNEWMLVYKAEYVMYSFIKICVF